MKQRQWPSFSPDEPMLTIRPCYNVFTNDNNKGDETDAEFDLTPSRSWQKEKPMALCGQWQLHMPIMRIHQPSVLSCYSKKNQQATAASSPVEFLDLYLTSSMLD